MKSRDLSPSNPSLKDKPKPNRRLTERMPADIILTYSGMETDRILMGEGLMSNLSDDGICIVGTCLVKKGMELTLFLHLPGEEEPVCIPRSKVAWVAGHRFGVEILFSGLEARQQLRLHAWNHRTRSAPKK
jgi:hypothetical protein